MRAAAGMTGLLVAAGLTATGTPVQAAVRSGPLIGVIVRTGSSQDADRVEAAVRRSGGTVGRPLALISGFAAQIPSGAVAELRATRGVAEVTADGSVRMTADQWNSDNQNDSSVDSVKTAAGIKTSLTGAGIGVALIDSGVAPVTGLKEPGKVINGPDLSFESQTPGLANIDTYGHGTHMAGIIAGSDPSTVDSNRFQGIAPGAHLISLKVAASDGATDVSQVIAAIDWAVTHRNDTGLNIRVLNLSFGTDSTQDEKLDPLSYAVEAAWRSGIVVVVAVGNDGTAVTHVSMPAANPYVIAVGAADTHGTVTRTDDTVATFSSRGNTTRHADLLAAGRSMVSLRDPGSNIDTAYPGARITDSADNLRLFRGSGTSQATAVVSGSVALLLQQRPALSPDQVKSLLTRTADPIAGAVPVAAGAGQINVAAATALATPTDTKVTQTFTAATGLGKLEASRGTAHVADATTGTMLTGEKDIFGAPWVPAKWAPLSKTGNAWSGGIWNGNTWSGTGYTGSSWASVTWGAATWTVPGWTGRSWTGSDWSGRSWTTGGWTGRSWTTGTWFGRSWTGGSWT